MSERRARSILMTAALAAALAACGGDDAPAPWVPVGSDVTGVVCPADPVTFVGPLQPECLPPRRV